MASMRIAFSLRLSLEFRYDDARDSISRDWLRWCLEADVMPLLVPNIIRDPVSYLRDLQPDLLILTSGDTPGIDKVRDETEKQLLSSAINRGLPVFGVCRGMQFINLFFGGTLIDVEGHNRESHEVEITNHWHDIYGNTTTVNSFHKVTVSDDGLGNQLVTAARCGKNEVEALYHRDLPIAAVMWHPEREDHNPGDVTVIRRLATEGAFWRSATD